MLATSELIRETSQRGRLEELFSRWRNVPLYREALTRPDFEFSSLPLIAKREMRNGFPRNFLPEDQSLDALVEKQLVELEHTSGTSEDRLPVIFARGWWEEQELRALRLNETIGPILEQNPRPRRATITAPACNGLTCPTVWMSREQRIIGQTLYVNLARIPFLLTDNELARMAAEIAEWAPVLLDLDPVHGVRFALYCEEHGLTFPSLKFILSSYEFSSVVHRKILDRVFRVPVYNLYGSTETGHLLMENAAGEMKPVYETAFLELVDSDPRGIGSLVVTTLTNDLMPLLRYRIGDLAQKFEPPYGAHYVVHGRARDVLQSKGGEKVTTWQVDQCLKEIDGIAHYEVRQEADGSAAFRFVPEKCPPAESQLQTVAARISALLGFGVQTSAMNVLVPAASGKFRLTARVA
jgi:phenylacetate-CoA ligase